MRFITPSLCSDTGDQNSPPGETAIGLKDGARELGIPASALESDTNPFIPKDKIRFGKAVMLYYPFWKYIREDGCLDVTVYRPAGGTLLSGLQNMHREDNEIAPVPEEANILPATIKSCVYYPELHGIARAEELIGIPLWLISYKVKNSIYMVKVDAASGKIYEEWHPIKEPVNWRKNAIIA